MEEDTNPFLHMMRDEQLVSSVLKNDRKGVLTHLIRGADIDTIDTVSSLSPLMIACSKGYTSLIDVLLHYKADILQCDIRGMNSLKIALDRDPGENTFDIIRILLSHLDTPDTSKDNNGMTSMEYTIKNGNIPMFQLMLDYGYVVNYDSGFKVAAYNNKYEMLLFLIQMCKFPLSQRHKNDILYEGCRGGHEHMMTFAIQSGAVFETHKNYLLVACETFDVDIVRYVLHHGIPFDIHVLVWVKSTVSLLKSFIPSMYTDESKLKTRRELLHDAYEIYFTLKRYTKPYDIHQGIHNCCICYNDTLFNHAKTSCDHIYCIPCINTWLKDHTTCPLCRKVIHA